MAHLVSAFTAEIQALNSPGGIPQPKGAVYCLQSDIIP